jgi:hypothetical protein
MRNVLPLIATSAASKNALRLDVPGAHGTIRTDRLVGIIMIKVHAKR